MSILFHNRHELLSNFNKLHLIGEIETEVNLEDLDDQKTCTPKDFKWKNFTPKGTL